MNIVLFNPEGSLLSCRSAVLPGNAMLDLEGIGSAQGLRADIGLAATFDIAAVGFLNRLCEHCGAALVLVTPWTTEHSAALLDKLLAAGIAERHLHEDWVCQWSRLGGAPASIRWWLRKHRGGTAGYAVIISMKECGPGTVAVDPVEGLTVEDYRLACGYLGGIDKDYGVAGVSPQDWERAEEALGSGMAACRWLHGGRWPTRPTNAGLLTPQTRRGAQFGPGGEPDDVEANGVRREQAWMDLAAVTPPTQTEPGPRDMDF